MVNTAVQGRRVEHAIRDDLIARGFYVVRSAGSKGRVDLVAIGAGVVLLVQCKRNAAALRPAERDALRELAEWADHAYAEDLTVRAIVAEKQPRAPIVYRSVDFAGDGPRGREYDPHTTPMEEKESNG